MVTWTINPTAYTGVVTGPNSFRLPKNDTDKDIVYTVTYTDDNNCSATQEYIVKAQPPIEKTDVTIKKGDVFYSTCDSANSGVTQVIYFKLDKAITLNEGEIMEIRLTGEEGTFQVDSCVIPSQSYKAASYDFTCNEKYTETNNSFKTLTFSPNVDEKGKHKVNFDKTKVETAECLSLNRYNLIWSKE